jgi:hypothetical protein
MAKAKNTNNGSQYTTQKTKDWPTQTSLLQRVNSGAPEGKDFLLQ